MPESKTSPKRRNNDLAMIHIAARRLFGDVSKGGDGRDEYEAWLRRHTGKSSAGKLTTSERIDLIKRLRREGLAARLADEFASLTGRSEVYWEMVADHMATRA